MNLVYFIAGVFLLGMVIGSFLTESRLLNEQKMSNEEE